MHAYKLKNSTDMQTTYDREVRQGRIIKNGWLPNCTSDGRLAFKLIIQSGHHYEDKERVGGK